MIFLKLGGSLITDKSKPETVRTALLEQISSEIAGFITLNSEARLLIGHGSGSFGHHHAARYRTHLGAGTPEEWRGFSEVWAAANRLNVHVVNALMHAGLPVIRFAPSSSAVARNGRIEVMQSEPILRSLDSGLIPVVHGDTAFDRERGATILSTEEVFRFLAPELKPDVILLAGVEDGVYRSYTDKSTLVKEITPEQLHSIHLEGSQATDVTGGMLDKVTTAFELLKILPHAQVHIFSGLEPGSIRNALDSCPSGTHIHLS